MTGIANTALLSMYTVEAIGKIYAARLLYFRRASNVFDFAICFMGWIGEMLTHIISVSWLRIFRLWRLLRLLNAMSQVSEIHMLVSGLAGAIRAMFYGAILLVFVLLLCAVVLVQFVHPTSSKLDFNFCERCPRAFASTHDSMLTLFQQVVAGDSWGYISIPVIEENPRIGLLLPMMQLLIAMGIMNLILAVVVDRAMESREASKEAAMMERMKEQQERKSQLLTIISEFDADMSGTLSPSEIRQICQESEEVRMILHGADVHTAELQIILEALSAETEDGEIGYGRFCDIIDDIEAVDMRKLAVVNFLANALTHTHQTATLRDHSQLLCKLDKQMSKLTSCLEHLHLAAPSRPSTEDTSSPQVCAVRTSNTSCSSAGIQEAGSADSLPELDSPKVDSPQGTKSPDEQLRENQDRFTAAEQLTGEIFEKLRFTDATEAMRTQLLQDLNHITAHLGRLIHSGQHQQGVLLQCLNGLHENSPGRIEAQLPPEHRLPPEQNSSCPPQRDVGAQRKESSGMAVNQEDHMQLLQTALGLRLASSRPYCPESAGIGRGVEWL